ncbi:GyrI-like domain-containing protein [Halobacillus sp. Marseille-Q1614]|uniref:GyrI-like domain-containing protein n=1 Tax=Halobacillus sp. Marseille-Q1614 TaxID=2709134 RepID=UPI00156EA048|nr:GyrI-like domain-containing protein [Halobacillus sp. Marseille-Q1614]
MGESLYKIANLPGYRGIGLRWEGPYTEIHSLKKVISSMNKRVNELPLSVDPEVQLGLSYHIRPDGFVHYSVFEVEGKQQIPEDMVEIVVPALTYLLTSHKKGQNIGSTYERIYEWLQKSDYVPYAEPEVEYYDKLPIKYERYPANRDLEDPHFDILIPIMKSAEK